MKLITQSEFEAKFTQPAFTRFLKGLETSGVNVASSDCFIGRFIKDVWPNAEVSLAPSSLSVNGVRLLYPEWGQSYINYLYNLMNPTSSEFAAAAKSASLEFLK